ncbi:unnamed protein product [Vicia faba]|uniref:Uncharacterized protein n=1 Tax=Vicia faba TaxID=3906 RepID=A0AAV1AKG8_VICFA|nr:unnamed protein product [Vicia faba]
MGNGNQTPSSRLSCFIFLRNRTPLFFYQNATAAEPSSFFSDPLPLDERPPYRNRPPIHVVSFDLTVSNLSLCLNEQNGDFKDARFRRLSKNIDDSGMKQSDDE